MWCLAILREATVGSIRIRLQRLHAHCSIWQIAKMTLDFFLWGFETCHWAARPHFDYVMYLDDDSVSVWRTSNKFEPVLSPTEVFWTSQSLWVTFSCSRQSLWPWETCQTSGTCSNQVGIRTPNHLRICHGDRTRLVKNARHSIADRGAICSDWVLLRQHMPRASKRVTWSHDNWMFHFIKAMIDMSLSPNPLGWMHFLLVFAWSNWREVCELCKPCELCRKEEQSASFFFASLFCSPAANDCGFTML